MSEISNYNYTANTQFISNVMRVRIATKTLLFDQS